MRVTKGHRNNRRSHHALKAPRLSLCSNCGAYHQRHRVCLECGFYKGEQILDIKNVKKAEAKVEKTEAKEVVEKAATKTVKKDAPKKVEAKKETVKKTVTKKTTSGKGDDLTKIEGVGPVTEKVLNKAGYKSFADIADSKVGELRDLLSDNKLGKFDPKSWSKQARLARDEKWDELKVLQDELMGGM